MRIAPIPGLVGFYASEDGRILSTRSGEQREIKQRENRGYMQVTVGVKVNGAAERHRRTVHRLVLLAFRGVPNDPSAHGRHLNGNSLDNHIDNLAWGSPLDNASDAMRHGTLGVGMRSRRRKLNEAQVTEIKSRKTGGESVATIAKDFGIHPKYIYHLMDGRCWPHV